MGHDLVMFLRPRPVHEADVIDHREIVEECQRRYGKPLELAVRSTSQSPDGQVPRVLRHGGAPTR
jgi:hypothetical protein